jgi:hypothetical protein
LETGFGPCAARRDPTCFFSSLPNSKSGPSETLIADKRPFWWFTLRFAQATFKRKTTGMERINFCNLLYSKDFYAASTFGQKFSAHVGGGKIRVSACDTEVDRTDEGGHNGVFVERR